MGDHAAAGTAEMLSRRHYLGATAMTAVTLDIGLSLLLHRVNEQFYRPFGPAAEGLSPSVLSIALSPVVMFAALTLAILVMVQNTR